MDYKADNRAMTLYDTVKYGYEDLKKQKKHYKSKGYYLDKKLSNNYEQVLYNPVERKMIMNVAGSHTLWDWVHTDPRLALGNLKGTARYKEAENVLKLAKKKYNPNETVLTGHSLGGSIASYIGSGNDKFYTLNKGATIGQSTRDNEKAYRVQGDLVSGLASNKNLTTLSNNSIWVDPYNSHSAEHIKNTKIFV